MRQKLKGNKRWRSDNATHSNANHSGPDTALKQVTWEGRKINWVMILARGRMCIDVLPDDWELNGDGMAAVVGRLEGKLRRMLGPRARMPRVLFTDRGTGMYSPAGHIVNAYDEALRGAGFRSFWGPDARAQAADMPDLLPHETAISWFRNLLRKEKPVRLPWEETKDEWITRTAAVLKRANRDYDVEALCKAFPKRLQECLDAGGGRTSH